MAGSLKERDRGGPEKGDHDLISTFDIGKNCYLIDLVSCICFS
jgi:hypothetical protein